MLLRLFLLLATTSIGFASAKPNSQAFEECASEHLWDAIAINKARLPVYAMLSDQDSKTLSRLLIASEYAALFVAYPFEAKARYFWREGIPILCKDFVSMSTVKPMDGLLEAYPPSLSEFSPPDGVKMKNDLLRVLKSDGCIGVHHAIEGVLPELAEEPRFLCMTRHILESAARVAWLAPQYDEMAEEKGLKRKPSELSQAVLELHLKSIPLAVALDRRAAHLAARGVRVLCDDVPVIDVKPNL